MADSQLAGKPLRAEQTPSMRRSSVASTEHYVKITAMQDAPPPAAAPTQLKVTAEVDRGHGASQRVTIAVEGQGPLAEQVAAEVAELFKRAVARALDTTSGPQHRVTVAEPATSPERVAPASAEAPMPVFSAATDAAAPKPIPWFQQHRSRISLSIGAIFFALAVLVPMLVPAEMRREILPMPIALGLVGALSLFSGLMPEPDRSKRGAARQPLENKLAEPQSFVPAAGRTRASVAPAYARAPSTVARTFGAAFGALFAITGLAAPLVLPDVTADERFVMMLGFAPIALAGAFLMWVFLRRPVATTSPASRGPRPHVSGATALAPGAMTKSTGALAALGVILGVVVLLVTLATVLPLLNAQP
jgi:hypothetical protein